MFSITGRSAMPTTRVITPAINESVDADALSTSGTHANAAVMITIKGMRTRRETVKLSSIRSSAAPRASSSVSSLPGCASSSMGVQV